MGLRACGAHKPLIPAADAPHLTFRVSHSMAHAPSGQFNLSPLPQSGDLRQGESSNSSSRACAPCSITAPSTAQPARFSDVLTGDTTQECVSIAKQPDSQLAWTAPLQGRSCTPSGYLDLMDWFHPSVAKVIRPSTQQHRPAMESGNAHKSTKMQGNEFNYHDRMVTNLMWEDHMHLQEFKNPPSHETQIDHAGCHDNPSLTATLQPQTRLLSLAPEQDFQAHGLDMQHCTAPKPRIDATQSPSLLHDSLMGQVAAAVPDRDFCLDAESHCDNLDCEPYETFDPFDDNGHLNASPFCT